MKALIFFVISLFLSLSISATLPEIKQNQVSFFELNNNPAKYNEKLIDVIGVLSVQDGEAFLCETMDDCLSWSKSRIGLDLPSLDKASLGGYKMYDSCHVIIIGKFLYDSKEGSRFLKGNLKSGEMQIGLSVSRVDYHKFNKNCAVWNNFVEGYSIDERAERLRILIDNMRNRTR
ncbi:MAG: hypothetical protein R3359_12870 [Marinirhabdus sp.]|nr:hypothetical protein [Marinirhabdus sp.]